MNFADLHPWTLTPSQAVCLQRELAGRVERIDQVTSDLRLAAGVDVSYRRRSGEFHAAVVVLDAGTLQAVEEVTASGVVAFPYVPGLLSFRELPVLLEAFRRLETVPDVILADAQGIAHPRRFGLASHLGLWLGLPTIGCAKSRLCGEAPAPGWQRGAWTVLRDGDEEVGRVVRTKDRVRPLFVSPGHRVDCARACEIVLQLGGGYRLPEPTRRAHLLSNRVRIEAEGRKARR